jgi:hypothetical protein
MFDPPKRFVKLLCLLSVLTLVQCSSYDPDQPVSITITDQVVKKSPNRLGINIGESTYFGDQQISSTLLPHGDFSRGQQVSFVRNKTPHATIVSDRYARPEKPHRNPFVSFEGGTYYIGSGPRAGETGHILQHASGAAEYTLEHSGVPIETDDVIWIKGPYTDRARPESKYDENLIGIGDFRTLDSSKAVLEFIDNESKPGDQILNILFSPSSADESGGLKHYFNAAPNTEYIARVRARSDSPYAKLNVTMANLGIPHGESGDLIRLAAETDSNLTPEWKTYTFRATTTSNLAIANRFSAIKFSVRMDPAETVNRSAQIDWVELEDGTRKSETGFNANLLPILKEAQPGVIRFYQLAARGATMDSITARSTKESPWKYISSGNRYYMQNTHGVMDNCLTLSKEMNAKPWIAVGGANDPNDWYQLISYLAAPEDFDEYSRKRASHGFETPWTHSFETIYLEIGNEWWNTLFRPFHIWTPGNYGELCNTIIRKIKTHPHFDEERIKIVIGGWAANARDWNAKLDETVQGHDFISLAPYMIHRLDHFDTEEEKYSTLFADVEGYGSRAGDAILKELKKSKKNTRFAIYELNTHLTGGEAPPSVASEICPSLAAGIAVLDMSMTLMREMKADPITYFTLLKRADNDKEGKRVGLWGNLLRDPDGTFRSRPVWEGLSLANNHLIQGDMVEVRITNSPTWKQAQNGSVPAMKKVPVIHAYAFHSKSKDTGKRTANVLVINRSLYDEIPLDINLPFTAISKVNRYILGGNHYTDNNENGASIQLTESTVELSPDSTIMIPPFSAIVYQFQES